MMLIADKEYSKTKKGLKHNMDTKKRSNKTFHDKSQGLLLHKIYLSGRQRLPICYYKVLVITCLLEINLIA